MRWLASGAQTKPRRLSFPIPALSEVCAGSGASDELLLAGSSWEHEKLNPESSAKSQPSLPKSAYSRFTQHVSGLLNTHCDF